MCDTAEIGQSTGPISLDLQNKQDRESVAMSLYRAGYTVREVKKKENGKTVVILEYWR